MKINNYIINRCKNVFLVSSIFPFFFAGLFFVKASHAHQPLVLGELEQTLTKKEKSTKAALNSLIKKNENAEIENNKKPIISIYKTPLIPLPKEYYLPNDFVVRNGKLDLTSLTTEVLSKLTKNELSILLEYLAQIEIKIKFKDEADHRRSGKNRKPRLFTKQWDRTNAAAAMALTLAVEQNYELFSTCVALAPFAILPLLKGHTIALIESPQAAKIVQKMIHEIDDTNSPTIARAVAAFTQQYLEYWGGSDWIKLDKLILQLISATHHSMQKDSLKEQRIGILIGSLLAGAYKQAIKIKDRELKKLVIINSISNLVWAATSFLAAVPLAGSAIGGMVGALSVSVVGWAVIHNVRGIKKDYLPNITGIKGEIVLRTAAYAQKKNSKRKLSLLMTNTFMEGAILANGIGL